MSKFGTKNAWFAYFWGAIWKYYCHIWNLHPRICLVAKFGAKTKIVKKNFVKTTKMLKFGTKNVLLGYFWLEFENNILIFERNTPDLSNCKISWRKNTKMFKFSPKIVCWFAYFCVGIWKCCRHIWNLCPRICLAAKFGEKIKIFRFGTKKAWFGYFLAGV